MAHVLVVYDIPHDGTRTKVASICEDYGLDRVQYSAFAGELQKVHQEELMAKLRRRLGKLPGKISLFAICERDWRARIEIVREANGSGTAEGEEGANAGGE